MSSQLEVLGPQRDGLLHQFQTVSWKYRSNRFGLLGQSIQYSFGLPEDWAIKKASRFGQTIHRRLEGKNGWLWKTLYDHQQKIRDMEYKYSVDYMPVPKWIKWIRGIIQSK